VLHLPPRLLLPRLCVSFRHRLSIHRLLPLFSTLVTFGAAWTLRGHAKWRGKMTSGHPDIPSVWTSKR
jgi:hypothetical protein